ncbi:MAG: T9SS type A sorting domain-containing protein, partial [Saprospiraceae bacterium]|nr:T9SS type A sorting domain-containing protein [Saprospiraceae bacterium]
KGILMLLPLLLTVFGLQAQWAERTWQPFPFTELAGAVPVEGGAVLAFKSGPPISHGGVRLDKVNADLAVTWSRDLCPFPGGGCALRGLQSLPDGRIFAATYQFGDCQDAIPADAYILWQLLDPETGEVLDIEYYHLKLNWIESDTFYPFAVLDTSGEARVLMRVDDVIWTDGGSFGEWDTLFTTISAKKYLAAMALPDQRFVTQTETGIRVFDYAGEEMMSLAAFWEGNDVLQAIHAMPDGNWLFVFHHQLIVTTPQPVKINGVHFPALTIHSAIPDGNTFLVAGFNQAGNMLFRLDTLFQFLASYPATTNNTFFHTAFPSGNDYLLAGSEKSNAFAVVVNDLDEQAEFIRDLKLEQAAPVESKIYPNGSHSYLIDFSGWEVTVGNNGTDTIESFHVSLEYPENFPWNPCKDLGIQKRFDSISLAPGGTMTWMLDGFVLVGIRGMLDDPDKVPVCVIVSCPDDQMDSDHSNDVFCFDIDLSVVQIQEVTHESGMSIWPNPAGDKINLAINTEKTIAFQIVNHLGQVMQSGTQVSGISEINTAGWHSGWYSVVARDAGNQQVYSGRFFKN